MLTLLELFDMIIMVFAIGYIFKDSFSIKHTFDYDPLKQYSLKSTFFKDLLFAAAITAPAIILHELGHKLVALSFGMDATFHAAYTFLAIAVLLKLFNSPFLIVAPAYIAWNCTTAICAANLSSFPLIPAMIAFAGPLVNLILWLGALLIHKFVRIPKKYLPALLLTSKINMFLFIFNILPIPGFDGYHVLSNIFTVLF